MASSNQHVRWEDLRSIAEKTDALGYERVFLPHADNGRYTKNFNYTVGEGSSYNYNVFPDLTKDVTTPFPVSFPCGNNTSDKNVLYQRFEFAYYRVGYGSGEYVYEDINDKVSTSYNKRYYKDGSRRPVCHTMFVQQKKPLLGFVINTGNQDIPLSPSDVLDNSAINSDVTPEDLVYNLIESKRHQLYKWWPCISHYDNIQNISAELYYVAKLISSNCLSTNRVCHALGEDGISKNGNGNSYPDGDNNLGIYDRPFPVADFSMPQLSYRLAVTLNKVDFKTFDAELYQGATKLYTPPPINQNCMHVQYPIIGFEGGNEQITDGSAWTSYHTAGVLSDAFHDSQVHYNTFYPPNIFDATYNGGVNTTRPHSVVAEYDPAKSSSSKTYNPGTKHINWCEPTDIDKYEQVSKYEEWNGRKADGGGGYVKLYVRVTPIRFYYEKLDQGIDLDKRLSYAFVWVPTAIIVPVEGLFQPAIRQRWYDMVYHRLRYIAGLWEAGETTTNAIGCYDTDSYGNTGDWEVWSVALTLGECYTDTGTGSDCLLTHDTKHPCGDIIQADIECTDSESPNPTGVSWSYNAELEFNPLTSGIGLIDLDAPASRWERLGLTWFDDTGGYLSDVSSAPCGSYYGTKYWELYMYHLRQHNPGVYVSVSGDFRVDFNKPSDADCYDAVPGGNLYEYSIQLPWRGGGVASASGCNGVASDRIFYLTIAKTTTILEALCNKVSEDKWVEPTLEGLWNTVDDWRGTIAKWKPYPVSCIGYSYSTTLLPMSERVFTLLSQGECLSGVTPEMRETVFGEGIPKTLVVNNCPIRITVNALANAATLYDLAGNILCTYGSRYSGTFNVVVKFGLNTRVEFTVKVSSSSVTSKTAYLVQNGTRTLLTDSYSTTAAYLSVILCSNVLLSEVLQDVDTVSVTYFSYRTWSRATTVAFPSGYNQSSFNACSGNYIYLQITILSLLSSDCGGGQPHNKWKLYKGDEEGDPLEDYTCLKIHNQYLQGSENFELIVPLQDNNRVTPGINNYPNQHNEWWYNGSDKIIVKLGTKNVVLQTDESGNVINSSADNACAAAATVWVPYLFSGIETEGEVVKTHNLTLRVSSPMMLGAMKANTYKIRNYEYNTCQQDTLYQDMSGSGRPESNYAVPCDLSYDDSKCPLITNECNEGGIAYIKPWVMPLGKEYNDYLAVETLEGNVNIRSLNFLDANGDLKDMTPEEYVQTLDTQTKEWQVSLDVTNLYRGYIGFTIIMYSFQQEATETISDLDKLVYEPKHEYFLLEVQHD